MASIRKIKGKKGTTYQVRFVSRERESGYGYSTFDTLKDARDFIHNIGTIREAKSGQAIAVSAAVERWIAICEKTGRDGRERVEPETLKEYKRRAKVTTDSGKPIALTNFVAGAWQPLMREAGLIDKKEVDGKQVEMPRYSPYALRHYYASKLIELGRDFKSIQTALGHSSIEITFDVYGHLIRGKDDAHRQAAEALTIGLL